MTNDEQYVPDEQDLEVAWIESEASADDINVASADFDRFLARVRRDAAREALDGLAREAAGVAEASNEHTNPWVSRVVHGWAEEYRDTHYPEETP